MIIPSLQLSLDRALALISQISPERKVILDQLVNYVVERAQKGELIQTNTICTHNSRRSHLGQVWIATMANYFGIAKVRAFSGGTQGTAVHPNTIAALRAQGFGIEQGEGSNPVYRIQFAQGEEGWVDCWSKKYDDAANPQTKFAAILVCGSADGACPIVLGADLRLSCTYVDPKVADGGPEQDKTYQERSLQIGSEMAYVMCQAAAQLGRVCGVPGCC